MCNRPKKYEQDDERVRDGEREWERNKICCINLVFFEMELPSEPSYPSVGLFVVGRSVKTFSKVQEVTLPCSYRSSCFYLDLF